MVGYLVTGNRTSVPDVAASCKAGYLALEIRVRTTRAPGFRQGPSPAEVAKNAVALSYLMIFVTVPEPTVRPPCPLSIARASEP